MKKLLAAAILLFSTIQLVNAQGARVGVKLGTNLNKISGQSFKDGFDLSYHVGGF